MAAVFSKSIGSVAPVNEGAVPDPVLVADKLPEFSPIGDSAILGGDRLLAFEGMHLLISLDSNLREARAQWNQDWFRRLMRIRPKAVARLRRRWAKLDPPPAIPLGTLRRRYHANLARYLYQSR
jgi:hypothetical protein